MIMAGSEELDKQAGHVIATHLLVGIPGEQLVEECFEHSHAIESPLELGMQPRDEWLVVIDVALEDAIAADEHELILGASTVLLYIWLTNY